MCISKATTNPHKHAPRSFSQESEPVCAARGDPTSNTSAFSPSRHVVAEFSGAWIGVSSSWVRICQCVCIYMSASEPPLGLEWYQIEGPVEPCPYNLRERRNGMDTSESSIPLLATPTEDQEPLIVQNEIDPLAGEQVTLMLPFLPPLIQPIPPLNFHPFHPRSRAAGLSQHEFQAPLDQALGSWRCRLYSS